VYTETTRWSKENKRSAIFGRLAPVGSCRIPTGEQWRHYIYGIWRRHLVEYCAVNWHSARRMLCVKFHQSKCDIFELSWRKRILKKYVFLHFSHCLFALSILTTWRRCCLNRVKFRHYTLRSVTARQQSPKLIAVFCQVCWFDFFWEGRQGVKWCITQYFLSIWSTK